MEKKADKKPEKKQEKTIAKINHVIHQNQYHFDIKKGDDISKIPEHFKPALIAEGVI